MVRISDILRGGQTPEPDKEKKEEKPIPIPSGKQPLTEEPREKERKTTEGIQLSKAMSKEQPEAEKEMQVIKAAHQMQLDPEESERIYDQALAVIKDILDKIQAQGSADLEPAYETVANIVDRVVLGDKELMSLTCNFSGDNYLYGHAVNSCILAIEVGLGLGYNKSKLNALGIGAFLHDLGMIKVMDIALAPRRLNEIEGAEIKKHPLYNADILSNAKDIQEEVVVIAKQNHERLNGSGYPEGLKNEQIHEYAKIVAVIDVYEALTHPRPYRKALDPHNAIKEISNASGLFDLSIFKVLINRIGIYPIGSWIELNTGEIAKVTSSNADAPLRPKVHILFGSDRKRLSQIKPFDLFRHSTVFIKRSVNPQDLNLQLD